MIGYSTVTQKGQVTIPASIREVLGLLPRQRVMIIKDAEGARIKPAPDFFSLFGSVKTKKKMNIRAVRRSFIRYLGTRHRGL